MAGVDTEEGIGTGRAQEGGGQGWGVWVSLQGTGSHWRVEPWPDTTDVFCKDYPR